MPLRTGSCLWWIRIAEDNLLVARRVSSNSTKSGTTLVLSCCGAARGCRRQQDMMPHGDGNGHAGTDAADRLGESITAGNGSKDLSRRFSMSSSDDTNSNIMFVVPGSKKAKVLRSIRAGWQEGKVFIEQ
uniref:Predicted protein n=1 Tax=Hordeum vulgare subsp. vulgare TaxID=112509 RepID=F2E1X3_HORVV|nr:predicted protein [Hordeum vulgare subsp. vulgare]